MSNPIKALAGQTVVYGLGTILPRLLNYLLTPVLVYTFAPAEFGINSELYAYISFLNVLFLFGMETTFFNFNSRYPGREDVFNTAFCTIFLSTTVFSLLLFIFSASIADFLSTPNAAYLTEFITWSILIIASDALTAVPYARLRAEGKAMKFSLLKLTNVFMYAGLTVFFIKVCKPAYDNNEHNFYSVIYRPEVGIGYVFLANLIANLVSLVLLSPQLMKVRFSLNRALLTEMLVYSWPLVILGLAGTVNDTMDRILIKELMPDKSEAQNAQGIYGACYKVAMLMTIFTQAFRFASEPFFFSRAKEKNSRQTYALVMKYFVIFCLFIFLGTVLNLSWLQYIVDKEYRVGLRVVPVLLLAYLCYGVIVNLSIWFKLSGRTKFGAVISLFGAVITLTLNFIFVPRYSYIACAWATLAAYSGMMFLSYFLGQKYFPISYNLRAISVYSVIAFSFYGVSFLYNDAPVGLQLILNNLLILLFAWIIYKLEFKNLKKLNSNANPESKGDQPLEASAS